MHRALICSLRSIHKKIVARIEEGIKRWDRLNRGLNWQSRVPYSDLGLRTSTSLSGQNVAKSVGNEGTNKTCDYRTLVSSDQRPESDQRDDGGRWPLHRIFPFPLQ